MGGQHHAPAALPTGKIRYPLYRRLGGPQDRSGWVRKISPPPGFDPRTFQPVDSRYTDWALSVPIKAAVHIVTTMLERIQCFLTRHSVFIKHIYFLKFFCEELHWNVWHVRRTWDKWEIHREIYLGTITGKRHLREPGIQLVDDFKLSPFSEGYILYFVWFPGVWIIQGMSGK